MKVIDSVPSRSGRAPLFRGFRGCMLGCLLASLTLAIVTVAALRWFLSAEDFKAPATTDQAAKRMQAKVDAIADKARRFEMIKGDTVFTENEINSFLQSLKESRLEAPVRGALEKFAVSVNETGFHVQAALQPNIALQALGYMTLPWPVPDRLQFELQGNLHFVPEIGQIRVALRSIRLGGIELAGETVLSFLETYVSEARPAIEMIRNNVIPPFGTTDLTLEEGQIRLKGS